MSARDLDLLRSIFLDALGPQPVSVDDGPVKPTARREDLKESTAGAPELSAEQLSFLHFAEADDVGLEKLTQKVGDMPHSALVECASVCAEMLHHANMTDAQCVLGIQTRTAFRV